MEERNAQIKGNAIWIVLTCILTVAVIVLAAGLYHFSRLTLTLKTQIAEIEEENSDLSVEVVRHQEETNAAESEIRAVRVMNGILQQQDGNDEWIDVASVEKLQSEDPILVGRNKMQELIDKNREAVQNGNVEASEISPLIVGKNAASEDTLASFSVVESITEKTTTHTSKPSSNAMTSTPTAPAVTSPIVTQPVAGTDNTSGSSSDSGSSESGDGEDIGWTEDIL